MKRNLLFFAAIIVLFASCKNNHPLVSFKSDSFQIDIDKKGNIIQLTDIQNSKNYISTDTIAPLLSCMTNSKILYPVSASFESEILSVMFENNLEAKIKVEQKPTHITFELIEFNSPENIELIIWGPIPTTIKKIIGETVGVVRGDEFAIGIQALNPKTLGGYPWTDNDCMPQFDIFEQEDYSDLSEENKRETLYRVEAAKPEKFGSTLQAY